MHGYSSSSESDDPKRPRPKPQPSNDSNDKKKKHNRRRLPPQQSINRIWKRFSKRDFHTALSVLPFDPVQPPACSHRPNELIWDGYHRSAEECRRKVKKIVTDCRRINTRYRDPGFDLDFDLKREKGETLNGLVNAKFPLSSKTLLSSSDSVPKAVMRVHEIFDEPTFMKDIDSGDIKQGSLGDCWMITAMNGLANVDNGIRRLCVAHDTKVGIYGFVFYRDGEWVYSIIDDKLFLKSPIWDSPSMQRDLLQQIDREDPERVYRETYQTGSKALFFAQNTNQSETWIPLLEKAFAKAHGDYSSLSGGLTGEGLEDLSGGVSSEFLTADILDTDEFWTNEMSMVNREFLFGCSTGLLEYANGPREGIQTAHAYCVVDARTLKTGERLVKLRNPWGQIRKGIWEGAWSDGSKEWTSEAQEELGHKFGSDSVFWISYKDLLRKFTHFDRTRLFRDDDWRCCQRWIGVDVPWKANYHEKFQIKVTQDSPLIIVLSQLNYRYFEGLQGQYKFRLHFRLHQQDSPDAEDYIVRSNGNYFGRRSVSVEVPDMPAGTYTVYVMVTGERDTSAKSVEATVKAQLQNRQHNEKLASVGYAYDLAHSKAWDHLDRVAKLRRKRDFAKASTCRQKERRRNWEKRHLNRKVSKEQGKKDRQKKDDKREQWEQRQRKLEAEEELMEQHRLADEKRLQVHADRQRKQQDTKQWAERAAGEHSDDGEVIEVKVTSEEVANDADTEADDHDNDLQQQQPLSNSKPVSTGDTVAVKTEADVTGTPSAGPSHLAGGSSTISSSLSSSASPQLTPRTDKGSLASCTGAKQAVPPVSLSSGQPHTCASGRATSTIPTPTMTSQLSKTKVKATYEPDGDSSDSPVEDWEALYSSDDMVRKPRLQPVGPPLRDDDASEEDKLPEPWNAICIVGIRVYSKDAGLELRTVMEGGELLEDGMGEKGQADLDNAQANAGGRRAAGENRPPTEGGVVVPGSDYPAVVMHHDGPELVEAGRMGPGHSDIHKYIHIDSNPTTRTSTPLPTPNPANSKELRLERLLLKK